MGAKLVLKEFRTKFFAILKQTFFSTRFTFIHYSQEFKPLAMKITEPLTN